VSVGDARQWLDRRGGDVPPALQQRMLEAVDAGAGESVPAVLADASLACLRDALELCDDRAAALHLLAADALVTAACEAAAEAAAAPDASQESSAALDTLCADLTPPRLAQRLADA
jgi:hypothetical protein